MYGAACRFFKFICRYLVLIYFVCVEDDVFVRISKLIFQYNLLIELQFTSLIVLSCIHFKLTLVVVSDINSQIIQEV